MLKRSISKSSPRVVNMMARQENRANTKSGVRKGYGAGMTITEVVVKVAKVTVFIGIV